MSNCIICIKHKRKNVGEYMYEGLLLCGKCFKELSYRGFASSNIVFGIGSYAYELLKEQE